jgi:cell division protein FtsB
MPPLFKDRAKVLRWVVLVVLLICFALLQRELWFGQGGLLHGWHLEAQVRHQQQQNAALKNANAQHMQEVKNLKSGTAAVEEHARADLGLVKKGETFYQIVHAPKAASAPPTQTAKQPGIAPAPATGGGK